MIAHAFELSQRPRAHLVLVQDGPIYGNSEVTCGKRDNFFALATFCSDFYSDFYCGRREDNTISQGWFGS